MSNQKTSDPREQLCWDLYIEKLSVGVSNAYQSAIEAGYSQSHADNITLQGWFKERLQKLKRKDLVSKAEKLLEKTLDYKSEDDEGKIKVDLLRVQTDVAKHVTNSLGKEEGYENEKTIFIMPSELIKKNESTPSTITNS
jgi:phage terminase small subunit